MPRPTELAALYQDLTKTNAKVFDGWIELEKRKLRFLARCIRNETREEIEALMFRIPDRKYLEELQMDAVVEGNMQIEEERVTIAKRIQELEAEKARREDEIEKFVRERYS